MSIDDNGRDLPPESPFTVGAAEVPEATPRRNHLVLIAVSLASVVVLAVAGLGTAVVIELGAKPASTSSSGGILRQNPFGSLGSGSGAPGDGSRGFQDGQSIGQQAAAGDSAATPSTAAQEVGVVTINTVLQYERAEQAAGTGMIISSNGYILTNNHVVQSSTSISVTVESTGQTYSATVVGTDATADVAVLKLTGASGLHTVSFAQNEKVTVGEPIYSVGNAEGTGRPRDGRRVGRRGEPVAHDRQRLVGRPGEPQRPHRAAVRCGVGGFRWPAVRQQGRRHRHGDGRLERQRDRDRLRHQHRPGSSRLERDPVGRGIQRHPARLPGVPRRRHREHAELARRPRRVDLRRDARRPGRHRRGRHHHLGQRRRGLDGERTQLHDPVAQGR
ncbi:MAG: trypsin-like peptidase domain-containing protein [Galbitalea sp.]